jgi:hypothetical protein
MKLSPPATPLQAFRKTHASPYEVAFSYYSLIALVNRIHLTRRELELLAFAGVEGNISSARVRQEFCKRYQTTHAFVGNMVSKLQQMQLLVKEEGRIFVNPRITLDFTKPDLVFQVKLSLDVVAPN